MNVSFVQDEHKLQTSNRRLSQLLRAEPLTLATGGAGALEDTLWVWGVVGGKNVGKSTLINALAGTDIVDCGDDAGEGTFEPAAFVTADDLSALRARFAGAPDVNVRYNADAPASMRRLALVDLPDFDSLFQDHVETVRRISGALDGVIWVTTPKKVGDLRAIREIHRVLKARVNFVYVVNKMDWLLAQSDSSPSEEIDRAHAALEAQMRECDGDASNRRAFLISAQYPMPEAVLESIASRRGATSSVTANGAMAKAADVLGRNFLALREMLTTAPSSEAAASNKRANLDFQVRTQASQILEHHCPRATLDRLDRALDEAEIDELSARYFPSGFVSTLFGRLNSDRELFGEWSIALFRQRIACWPTLGVVAWPVMMLGGALGRLRGVFGSPLSGDVGDPFRCDGVGLDERVSGAVDGVRARLAGEADRLRIKLPASDVLERQFRQDVTGIVEHHREFVFESMLSRRPGFLGRMIRSLLPVACLLWFPLVQPLLVAVLVIVRDGMTPDAGTLLTLVQALSATKVLSGLAVSLLILAALAAAVFSRVVRDTYDALCRLRSAPMDVEPFGRVLISTIARPVEQVREQLATITESLEELAESKA